MRLFYLPRRGRPALLPVAEELEGLGVGVAMGTRCGEDVNVVPQHGGSGVRLRNVRREQSVFRVLLPAGRPGGQTGGRGQTASPVPVKPRRFSVPRW